MKGRKLDIVYWNKRELCRTLKQMGDDFITVEIEGQDGEYIIEAVTRQSNYSESPCSHICIKCRDGGQGYIKS